MTRQKEEIIKICNKGLEFGRLQKKIGENINTLFYTFELLDCQFSAELAILRRYTNSPLGLTVITTGRGKVENLM